jgi:YidC/Oxa1 family membrane protein insertase
MIENGDGEKTDTGRPTVLIAPSWQKDNILDSCIEQILDMLKEREYNIIVRPHPQYVRHFEERVNALIEKYGKYGIEVQKDFSSNKTVYTADVLVTDWSSIAYEYAFSTLKPVLFINTPMKVVNPDYKELETVPVDIELRDKVGISLELNDESLGKVAESVDELLNNNRFSTDSMEALRDKYIYNYGKSGKTGAKYIIDRLVEISNK